METIDSSVKEEILNLTEKLIRIRSVKGNPAGLKRIADMITEYFPKKNFSIKRIVSRGKHSVVVMPKGAVKPKLFFLSHADVVEAELVQFNPRRRGDYLYGRGSMDMKSGLAISMVLMKRNSKRSFGLMVTTDEEIGGNDGARLLASRYRPRFIIAPEASDLAISYKEKGGVLIRLTAKGKSCHASRPWEGKNAIDELIAGYQKIRRAFPYHTKEAWKTTMNLGIINGGEAPNIVPPSAQLELDIRYAEDDNPVAIIKRIKRCISGRSIAMKVININPMLINRKDDSNIKSFISSFIKVTGKKPVFFAEHGASDARYFSEKKISSIMFGPSGANCHGHNEYVRMSSVFRCYEVLMQFTNDYCPIC